MPAPLLPPPSPSSVFSRDLLQGRRPRRRRRRHHRTDQSRRRGLRRVRHELSPQAAVRATRRRWRVTEARRRRRCRRKPGQEGGGEEREKGRPPPPFGHLNGSWKATRRVAVLLGGILSCKPNNYYLNLFSYCLLPSPVTG